MVRSTLKNGLSRWIVLAAILLLFFAALAAIDYGHAAAQSDQSQWQAWYWNNTDLSGTPVLSRLEQEPGFGNLNLASPAPGVSSDDFSARWVNTVSLEAGDYTFAARVDDGVRVWVDDEIIIDDWNPQAAHVVAETVSLASGMHNVRVEYFDTRDMAILDFEWGPEGTVALAEQAAAPDDDEDRAPAGIGADFMGAGPLATVGDEFRLNLRTGPSVEYDRVRVLEGGTQLELLYRHADGLWVAVETPQGTVGWVNATYLNSEFATGQLPLWTGDPTTLAADAPPVAPSMRDATVISEFNLSLREGPGVEYDETMVLQGGTDVAFTGCRNETGRWVQISTPAGEVGWVNATYLDASIDVAELNICTPEGQVVTLPEDRPRAVVGDEFRLNVREGPSVEYDVVTTMDGGTPVVMLCRAGEGLWVMVETAAGTHGFVNATYLNSDFATGELPPCQ